VKAYSLERDIEDLEGLRKAMGYSSISILGHSYGGWVAQGYASKYPDNVEHLILANTFHSYIILIFVILNSSLFILTTYFINLTLVKRICQDLTDLWQMGCLLTVQK